MKNPNRFMDIYLDLIVYEEHFMDEDLSNNESKYRRRVFELCKYIVNKYGDEYENN